MVAMSFKGKINAAAMATRMSAQRRNGRSVEDEAKGAFLLEIQSQDAYERICRLMKEEDAGRGAELLDEVCGFCWAEHEKLLSAAFNNKGSAKQVDESLLKASRDEVARLQEQVVDVNKRAMRQINVLTRVVADDEPPVEFYEPLQCFTEKQRDLVMDILAYKLWQIENGQAPPGLLDKIRGKQNRFKDGDSDSEEDKIDSAELNRLRAQLKAMEMRLKEADDQAAKRAAEVADLQKSSELLRAGKAAAELRNGEMLERFQALSEDTYGVPRCGKGHEMCRRTCGAGESGQCEFCKRQYMAGDLCYDCNPCGVSMCHQCVMNSDKRDKRKNTNTKVAMVQTDLDMQGMDKMAKENKRLTVMLEEMKTKVGDMMRLAKAKGIQGMDAIIEDVGLKALEKCPSVFEKLYQDAFDRVGRLETLRERLTQQKHGALSDLIRECSQKGMPLPPNILEEVQRSGLFDRVQQMMQNNSGRGDGPCGFARHLHSGSRGRPLIKEDRIRERESAASADPIRGQPQHGLLGKTSSLPSLSSPTQRTQRARKNTEMSMRSSFVLVGNLRKPRAMDLR